MKWINLVIPFLRVLILSLFLVSSAFAKKAMEKNEPENGDFPRPTPVGFLFAFGLELRPEMDVESNFQNHYLKNYALGYGFGQYVFLFEAAQFQEEAGNATLRVDRTLQDYMLWGQYRDMSWHHLVPFLGLGAGVYQETIVTHLYSESTTDAGPNKFLTGVSLGVGTDLPTLWLSVEVRLLFGDELDRNPTVGGLTRIGLHF